MPLAIYLIKKDYKINGSTTSNNKLSKLQSYGITPFIIDINDKSIDFSDFLLADVLIIAIPSKNINDYKRLISKIEISGISKVLFISSTSVYPNTNGIVTEETNTNNTPLANIEKLFISNPNFKSTIIRFGGLFGYDRKPGNFIKPDQIVENPMGHINLIHRDDCIRIIEQIIVKNVWNTTLNACSSSHPLRRDFYIKEAKKVGVTNINFNEKFENNYKIVSNEKLKGLLNYRFDYDDLMK